jgi:hypothetical protein
MVVLVGEYRIAGEIFGYGSFGRQSYLLIAARGLS